MSGVEITDAMIEAATDAYEEGVQPGDEFFGDRAEIRYMAEKVLRAGLSAIGDDQPSKAADPRSLDSPEDEGADS